ncbi:hypothetical protein ACFLRX_08720 [Acidobacteriota bacterium]
MIKRTFLIFLCFFCLIPLYSQEEKQKAVVINIEVPVRVYDGKEFIDSLSIDDFEIYENGILQNLEALYLFNGSETNRREDISNISRNQNRHFYFLMQIIDYHPKITDAIHYYFENVLTPNDTLTVITHMKTYTLSLQAMELKTKEKLANEMISLIRSDTQQGNSNYKTLINSLRRIIRALLSACRVTLSNSAQAGELMSYGDEGLNSMGVHNLLTQYRRDLNQLDDVRILDENTLKGFAEELKRQGGRKNVFLFYQREYKPELEDRYLNMLMSTYHDDNTVQSLIQDVFTTYNRKINLDTEGLKRACADSGALFNFIYSDNLAAKATGIKMRDQSDDFYFLFSSLALATGGKVATSFDPLLGFLEVLESSEKYYLLYYSPSNPSEDGMFRSITVKLKNLRYSVSHRMGYFAIKD